MSLRISSESTSGGLISVGPNTIDRFSSFIMFSLFFLATLKKQKQKTATMSKMNEISLQSWFVIHVLYLIRLLFTSFWSSLLREKRNLRSLIYYADLLLPVGYRCLKGGWWSRLAIRQGERGIHDNQQAASTKSTLTLNQSVKYLPNLILPKGGGDREKQMTLLTGQQASKCECKAQETLAKGSRLPLSRRKRQPLTSIVLSLTSSVLQ